MSTRRPAKIIVILIGGPGAGKSTQSAHLVKQYGFEVLSTGQLLRDLQKKKSALADRVRNYVSEGTLIPNEIINQLVGKRLEQSGSKGLILDGFPRTIQQAKFLEDKVKTPIIAIYINTPTDVLAKRLSNRGRADDEPEIYGTRIEQFKSETLPLLEYYQARDDLFEVAPRIAVLSHDIVFRKISAIVENEFEKNELH